MIILPGIMKGTIAPGSRIVAREEEWLVRRIDPTRSGANLLTVVGLSALVKDREARFIDEIEELEQPIRVVDPHQTRPVLDESPYFRDSRLFLESMLRQTIPADSRLVVGHQGAMDVLPFQLDPARLALEQPRQRLLIADAVGLGKTIISIDTIKQDGEYRLHLEQAWWDVIVIDEAHNVARRGTSSLCARVAELLSSRSDSLILLSATPHDGRRESFASIMNMLNPTAIKDEKQYGPDDIEGLFIRRFKKDIKAQVRGHFPERAVHLFRHPASPEEEAVYEQLHQTNFTAIDELRQSGRILFKTLLEKSLFSSPAACLETIRPELDCQLKKLAAFRDARMQQLELAFEAKGIKRQAEARKVESLYTQYQQWIRDTLETDDQPSIRILALFTGPARKARGGTQHE